MPGYPRIAIVILNWNGIHFLKQFLPDIKKNSGNVPVVIADNNSSDDSLDWLRKNHADVQLIEMKTNTGFAGGYNKALQQVKADIFILLNSDVEVTPGWIEPVIKLMESDPAIAACQPKILSYHQRNFLEHAGAAGGFIDYLGYPFCRGRIYNTLEKDKGQYDDSREVFWATGACLFVKASVFHELNGFDEDFFAHMEEIDLCWRMKQLGFKIMVEPKSSVYHVGGGTLPKSSAVKTYYNFRNNLMMIHKNLPAGKLWPVILIRLVLDGLAGIKFLFEGHASDCWSVVRAHLYFYKHYQRRKKIRDEFRRTIKNENPTFIYQKNIVFAYYVLGRKYFSELEDKFS